MGPHQFRIAFLWIIYEICMMFTFTKALINDLRRCDPNNIIQCIQPMHKHISEMGGLGETYDIETLEDICGKMDKVKECIENKKPWMEHCHIDNMISWNMFQKGFGYLCGEGYDVYAQNSRCLSNTQVNGTVRQCSRIWSRQLHAIILDEPPRAQKYKRTCRILKDYRSCLSHGIQRFCSKSAAHVMVKMWDLSLAPFREKMMCDEKIGAGLVVAVILGVCCFVLVAIFIVCLMRRRQLQSISYKRFTDITAQPSIVPPESHFPTIAAHALRQEDPARTNDLL
ncbi:uncharacterized protein LOC106883123 [Octopus bimaculoides]|nr:uncharacterized protein LOC106883123 [Octopus bimaculoides]